MIMNVTLPPMILTSISNAQGADKLAILKYLIVGSLIYLCLPFLARIFTLLLRVKKEERGLYDLFFVFSNAMFMGYPVAATIYGDGVIFYISIFHMLFNFLYFSYGIKQIQNSAHTSEKMQWKNVLNPGMIASVAALLLFFFDIMLPSSVITVLTFVGNISTPMSMIIIGATLGSYSLSSMFEEKRIYAVTILRLIVIPVLVYFLLTAFGFDGKLRGTAVITIAMPVASMVSMTCTQYQKNEKTASSVVAFTTICSLITIPVLLSVF